MTKKAQGKRIKWTCIPCFYINMVILLHICCADSVNFYRSAVPLNSNCWKSAPTKLRLGTERSFVTNSINNLVFWTQWPVSFGRLICSLKFLIATGINRVKRLTAFSSLSCWFIDPSFHFLYNVWISASSFVDMIEEVNKLQINMLQRKNVRFYLKIHVRKD